MLHYHGTGTRDYQRQPQAVRSRGNWEFQAVVAGRAAPLLPQGPLPAGGSCLWVFAPDCPHGWTAPAPCEVLVYHLAQCPEVLATLVGEAGWLRAVPAVLAGAAVAIAMSFISHGGGHLHGLEEGDQGGGHGSGAHESGGPETAHGTGSHGGHPDFRDHRHGGENGPL